MKRVFRRLVALFAVAPLLAHAEAFSRADWIADLDQLQSLLATNYPSLEWQARRGVDLPGILARARTQIESASSDADARAAIDRFLSRFGDGHLSIEWNTNQPDPADDAKLPDCERFGFRDDPDVRAIAPLFAGYEDITPKGGTVGAGFVTVDGKRVGVLRVALFMPGRTHCEQYLRDRQVKPPKHELEDYEAAIGIGATNLFLLEIEERLRQLAARQPAAILVDGAGNGGGNDSAIALARMLGGEGVRNPRLLYVREPIRAGNLAERAAELRAELRKASRRERAFANDLLATLDAGKAAADKPCDLMPLWKGEAVACSNRVQGPFYASGLVEYEVPEEWLHKSWARLVSETANYDPRPRAWRGPVIVLVDERSASATELFAAMLQDSKAALVIGAPTFGAGCGWTMGKYESSKILENSRARLVMPDCTRIRADGSDELDGIQPDLLIGIRRPDTQKQRAERVAARLPEGLKLVSTSRP
jgi:hypothetical protein